MEEAYVKRIMPNSEEAERSVIGSMIDNADAAAIASEILSEEDFYNQRYGMIFRAAMQLFSKNIPVDYVMLVNQLKENDAPAEVCSLEYLADIVNSLSTSANVKHHAQIVREKATLRRLIKISEDIAGRCYRDKEPIEEILEESEKQIIDIVQNRSTSDFVEIGDLVIDALNDIEAAAKAGGGITGIPTGFYDLDYMLLGLQPADLILLAARPSMGKTALALNIAEHAALKENVTTAVFTLEMSGKLLVNRFLSMNSRVNAQAMRKGDLKDKEWNDLMESAHRIGNSNIIIDGTALTVQEMRSKCRKLKKERNLGLVIIDYLQLMVGTKPAESRQQLIAEISRSLKLLAKELNCPVLALSQLSRAVEQRPDKHPMLSDLRESGSIEQDADVVMLIYRDEYYNKDSQDKGVAEIIIGKQRNGPTGTVKLGCQLEYTRFVNLQRRPESEGE